MGALQSTQKQGRKALQASARSSDTVPKSGAACEIGIKLTAQRMGALQSTQKQGQKALQASARSSDTVPKYGAASDGSLGGVRV